MTITPGAIYWLIGKSATILVERGVTLKEACGDNIIMITQIEN